jgi:hypothetical protein
MLGSRQYAAFTKAIKASKATWKVVVNEGADPAVTMRCPYDRWEGYAVRARAAPGRFLQANVRNVVFLTTDTHGNLVNEVRYRTSATSRAQASGRSSPAPVATNTFAKEIDGYLGQKGAGTAIGALFFKPAPPNGLGMRCAALDTYSYSEVTVAAKQLTVAMKDAKGEPVREATVVACAPLVLRCAALAAEPLAVRRVEHVHRVGDRAQSDPFPSTRNVAGSDPSDELPIFAGDLRETEDVGIRPELLDDLNDRRDPIPAELDRLGPKSENDGAAGRRARQVDRNAAEGDDAVAASRRGTEVHRG